VSNDNLCEPSSEHRNPGYFEGHIDLTLEPLSAGYFNAEFSTEKFASYGLENTVYASTICMMQ